LDFLQVIERHNLSSMPLKWTIDHRARMAGMITDAQA
jgi:hypothetical protein